MSIIETIKKQEWGLLFTWLEKHNRSVNMFSPITIDIISEFNFAELKTRNYSPSAASLFSEEILPHSLGS